MGCGGTRSCGGQSHLAGALHILLYMALQRPRRGVTALPYLTLSSSGSLVDLSPAAPYPSSAAGGGGGGNSSVPLTEVQDLSSGGRRGGGGGEKGGGMTPGWEDMTNTSSSSSSCSNGGGVSCRHDSEIRRWVVPWGEGVSGSEEVLLCVGRDCHLWKTFGPAAGGDTIAGGELLSLTE